jgi:hypothetical protein
LYLSQNGKEAKKNIDLQITINIDTFNLGGISIGGTNSGTPGTDDDANDTTEEEGNLLNESSIPIRRGHLRNNARSIINPSIRPNTEDLIHKRRSSVANGINSAISYRNQRRKEL